MDYEYGDPVLIWAPAFYREKKLCLFTRYCPDHDGAIRVLPINEKLPITDICVNPEIGDTIERLENRNQS